jgi:hypothetical protein
MWKLTKIDTYNGNRPGDWVNSYSGGTELFPTLIGSALNIPYVELSTSGGGYFHIKLPIYTPSIPWRNCICIYQRSNVSNPL